MDKFLRKLMILCAFSLLAGGFVACSKDDTEPEPEPEPVVPTLTIQGVSENGEVANAATSWDSASIKISTENIVEYAWILQTADESAPASEAIVFKNGTVVKPSNGTSTIEFKDLARLTDYVVYIAAKVPAQEEATRADEVKTEFYGEVIKVKFSTPDYSDEITVVKVKPDGFDLHVKFPASVSEKGSSIKWGVSNIAMYNSNKYSGMTDADMVMLNDGIYPAARFVNDTTLTIDEAHRYAMDDEGNIIVDEWMGEPIYYWDFVAPGEPLVLIMSEVAWGESDWGWGEGWYKLPFDFAAYQEAMYNAGPEDMPDESLFWEEGAWHKKIEVTTLPPAEFEGTVAIETKDLAPNGGKVVFTPDEKTNVFCVGIYDDATYNQYLDIYLGGNEDYLQWLSTSFYGLYGAGFNTVWADYDFDGTNDGPQEVNLADLLWEFTPGGTYHIVLTAMASREATQEEIDKWADMGTGLMPDQMSQSFQHITFTLPDYSMEAPELEVTPLDPTSPYEVSFNVKCTNYTESPVAEVAYAANYVREFNEELEYNTYADLCESNRNQGFVFSEDEIKLINSAEGCVITLPSREDATTRLAVMGWNSEGRPSVFEGENPKAVAEAKSGVVPDAPRVESELFGALDGEWTATATVEYQTYGQISEDEWGYIPHTETFSTKVVIGDVTYPEALTQDIYDLYEENGVSKEQTDAYFAEFKEQAEIYNKKVRGQNRILCTGWDFHAHGNAAYSNLRTATPWDLFTDNSGYNASDVSSIFYDFGAKWFLQVNEAGDVFVPVNMNRLAPLTRWTNGTDFHLAGVNNENETAYVYSMPLNEADMDDVSKWPNIPVEVSDDKQTITIKSFDFEGLTYYPNAFYTSTYWGMQLYNTIIKSEVVLTKGWEAADEDVDVEAVRKNATELKGGANLKSVSDAAIEAQVAPKSRSVYFEKKQAAHKLELKAVSFEQNIERMKQYIEKKKAARK